MSVLQVSLETSIVTMKQGKTIFPNIYHKDCLQFKSR